MSERALPIQSGLAVVVVSMLVGCVRSPVGTQMPKLELAGSDGRAHVLPAGDEQVRLTVLLFSAWHCPCQAVHDARLNALYARYHARGVDFFAVDSEAGGDIRTDAANAAARGYAFPVLLDPGAGLARALHAEYATESFVVDRQGTVRYHGGLDTDQKTLHENAVPLLTNALDDLLAGNAPRSAETPPLGCALQTW
jgi:peroxiredoxin